MENSVNNPKQKHSVSLNQQSYIRLLQKKAEYMKNKHVNLSISDMANIIISNK